MAILGGLLISAACNRGVLRPPAESVRPMNASPSTTNAGAIAPTPAHVGPRNAALSDSDLDALWERQLMVPVAGMVRASLHDDFTSKRGSDRIHGALDILASRSTPVLAPDDCVIGRMFAGPVGGIVIYATDVTSHFVYYFAHLDGYLLGLAVGDRVAKGSVIGYVGSTGNASADTPHLHFQVMKRGVGRAWWDGPPINPVSFFALDGFRP